MTTPSQYLPSEDLIGIQLYTDIFGEVSKILKISETGLMTIEKTRKDGSKSVWFKYPSRPRINPEYEKFISDENVKRDESLKVTLELEKEEKLKSLAMDIPQELTDSINDLKSDILVEQYKNGNTKAINSLVGKILKQHRLSNPSLVKKLLEDMMK